MISFIKSNIYYVIFLIYNLFITIFSFLFSIKHDNLSIRNIVHYNKDHEVMGVYYNLWVAYTTLTEKDDYCEIYYYYNNSIYILVVKDRSYFINYPPKGCYYDDDKILSAILYPNDINITNLLNQYSGHSKNFLINTPFYLKYTDLPFLQDNQYIIVIDNTGKKFSVSKKCIEFDPSDSDTSSDSSIEDFSDNVTKLKNLEKDTSTKKNI